MTDLHRNLSLPIAFATFHFIGWMLIAGVLLGIPMGFWGLHAGIFPADFIVTDATQAPLAWGLLSLCAGVLVAFKYGLYTSAFLYLARPLVQRHRRAPYVVGFISLLFYNVPLAWVILTRVPTDAQALGGGFILLLTVAAWWALNRYIVALHPPATATTAPDLSTAQV